jgi:hypothetical protein
MRKRKQRKKTSLASRFGRIPLLVFVMAAASIVIGAVTVASRQLAGTKVSQARVRGLDVAEKAGKNYVTVKVAGQDVQVDSQTGQIRPLTPQEAQQLAEGLKGMLNRSTEGLTATHHADGSVSVDLEGRFQNVAVAKKNQDGTVAQSCVDNTQSAAAFFGLSPDAFQDATKPAQTPTKTSVKQPNRQASKIEDQ